MEQLSNNTIIRELPDIRWGITDRMVKKIVPDNFIKEYPVIKKNRQKISNTLLYEGKIFSLTSFTAYNFENDYLYHIHCLIKPRSTDKDQAVRKYHSIKKILIQNFGSPFPRQKEKESKKEKRFFDYIEQAGIFHSE